MQRKTRLHFPLLVLVLLSTALSAVAYDRGDALHGEEEGTPICAHCGQPITGVYVTALGKTWHPEHFLCAHCRRPIGGASFYEKDGLPYCEACYLECFAPRCAVCGEPIRSTYLQNVWGDVYCERHQDEYEECYSCGRLICERLTGGGVRLGDGRSICDRCWATAIEDVGEAEPVLKEIRSVLARTGLDLGKAAIPIRLVDRYELEKSRAHASDPNGSICTCVWSENGRVVSRQIEGVSILHGLPREHFSAIAAHECGHAWLFLERFPALPPEVEEGFCELCAYLWLETRQTAEARVRMRMMEENDDPIYGEGFRAALRSYRRFGLAEVLRGLRDHGRFPEEG